MVAAKTPPAASAQGFSVVVVRHGALAAAGGGGGTGKVHAGRGGQAAEGSAPSVKAWARCLLGFGVVWWRGMRTCRGEALTWLNCSSSAGVSQGGPASSRKRVNQKS